MLDTILSRIFASQWHVIAIVSIVLLAAAELGFNFGLRLHLSNDQARKDQIGGIQGAMLGLLGLLLGFTFAMSVGRYESRRALVLQEANSIGTTYLRAAVLPDAHKTGVEDLLRRYVDVRLDFFRAGEDQGKLAAAERATAQIQRELWAHAVSAGKEAPTPITAIFFNALNDTIDLDATRMNARRTRVPGAVWLLVLAVAACGCCASGYGAGASGERGAFANVVLPLLIAVVITLIADLDRPRGGMIVISQQPMLDLKQSLQPDQP
ncbi:DUF4239 domain-containing protein [Pedosphaera parvula]|uniref:DUF4239 domain-containing protein n=1 Tax=Pedosphaera parvula (strain Ellin514) TaxID=320771 RepID=B9XRI5_PEDPL|nr:DUF4239 domain-containing protein [Pedosphaera parvula]EEF57556.1 conserved hypothetical protein [Pedosphaera parvula Ellin514]